MTNQELLNLFIIDGYSQSGKIKKKTVLAMMQYVDEHPELQRLVNIGDDKNIKKYNEIMED